MKTRADELFDDFKAFHLKNPRVWQLFCQFANEVISAGFSQYSADAIFHRIRWNVQIETKGGDLKLNDHHTVYYASMFMVAHPQHDGFFARRRRPSKHRQPTGEFDILMPPEDDDGPLRAELKKLLI